MTLTWDPGSADIIRYDVRRAADSRLEFGDWHAIAGSNRRHKNFAVDELANGSRYTFEVRAVNLHGVGEPARVATTLVANPTAAIEIASSALRTIVARRLGKSAGNTITRGDMATLRALTGDASAIADLSGLEFAANLTYLSLRGNEISDVSGVVGPGGAGLPCP